MKLQDVIRIDPEKVLPYLDGLFDQWTNAIMVINPKNLKFLYFNKAAQEQFGYSEEELMQMSIFDLQVGEIHEETKLHIENALKQGKIDFEALCQTKHNGIVKLKIKVQTTTDIRGESFFICTLNDITKSNKCEMDLVESEKKYKFLTEKISDVVWIDDMNFKTVYASPSLQMVLGFTQEERSRLSLEEKVTPASLALLIDFATKQLTIEEQGNGDSNRIETLELEYYHKDGSILWMETIFSGIRDDKGVLTAIQGVSRNITERKRMEKERQELENQLRHAEKMNAIGTLAGGIAHDFNNLLMGIQGYISLVLLQIDPADSNYKRLKQAEEQIQRGADLTKQLLGFASGGKYEVVATNMNSILEKTVDLFGRTKKEISIISKYKKDLWTVNVDRGQMEQVLMNLYINAWQAMPGGGELYLETDNVVLNSNYATHNKINPGRYIKISVIDIGMGMDDRTLERIFDPFFTTKTMGRGTGLGLAMVYGIIKGHEGLIVVASTPGNGTTFSIYLPASDEKVVKEKTKVETTVNGTETILLVDDEKTVLAVTRDMLESLGYKVYATGSGQEAVATYMEKRKKINLVILDMIMPGISGKETFSRLRDINPEIKAILSSGYAYNEDLMSLGFKGFFQKPANLKEISQKVREVLDEE